MRNFPKIKNLNRSKPQWYCEPRICWAHILSEKQNQRALYKAHSWLAINVTRTYYTTSYLFALLRAWCLFASPLKKVIWIYKKLVRVRMHREWYRQGSGRTSGVSIKRKGDVFTNTRYYCIVWVKSRWGEFLYKAVSIGPRLLQEQPAQVSTCFITRVSSESARRGDGGTRYVLLSEVR